jgi:hypothetical protein
VLFSLNGLGLWKSYCSNYSFLDIISLSASPVNLLAFLTNAFDRGEQLAFPSCYWEMSLPHALDEHLGGPQSQSGHGGEEKNSFLLPGITAWLSSS